MASLHARLLAECGGQGELLLRAFKQQADSALATRSPAFSDIQIVIGASSATTPAVLSRGLLLLVAAAALCLQNAYRIFYPQSTDIPGLQADQNPWYSQVCQALPVAP